MAVESLARKFIFVHGYGQLSNLVGIGGRAGPVSRDSVPGASDRRLRPCACACASPERAVNGGRNDLGAPSLFGACTVSLLLEVGWVLRGPASLGPPPMWYACGWMCWARVAREVAEANCRPRRGRSKWRCVVQLVVWCTVDHGLCLSPPWASAVRPQNTILCIIAVNIEKLWYNSVIFLLLRCLL